MMTMVRIVADDFDLRLKMTLTVLQDISIGFILLLLIAHSILADLSDDENFTWTICFLISGTRYPLMFPKPFVNP